MVVLMGLSRLDVIVKRLSEAGCSGETPAAVISRGAWTEQDVRIGTLEDIKTRSGGIASPAVIVFGVTIEERGRLREVRAAMSNRKA